jgi:transcriptional regulator with XRE-family HTH domain
VVADTPSQIGQHIAARRRAARMTQEGLAATAGISVAMVRAIERGARNPGDGTLEALAEALGVDASRLTNGYTGTALRVRAALPAISAAIAGYQIALDPPTIPLAQLQAEVQTAVGWRLAAQYGQIASSIPATLEAALQRLHATHGPARAGAARLVTSAARTADAIAYKHGAHDLSARLVDVMRWAADQTGDTVLQASVAYTGAETYLAAKAHRAGQRALESAIDAGPAPANDTTTAVRAALHMRAAVVAARAGDADAAGQHLRQAHELADGLTEGIYLGTAVGPSSVRIHEVAVAVSLGGDHIADALAVGKQWKPGDEIPAERRSGFYVELARAELWSGRPDDAFESLKVARALAPQAVREHPWAREDIETIRRLKRADAESLTSYAEWIGAL